MNADVINVYVNDTPADLDMSTDLAWLPILGPTATALHQFLLRCGRAEWPLVELAAMIGVKPSKLADAIERLSIFGAGAIVGTDVLVLRRFMPPLPDRHVRRIAARCESTVAA